MYNVAITRVTADASEFMTKEPFDSIFNAASYIISGNVTDYNPFLRQVRGTLQSEVESLQEVKFAVQFFI